MSNIPLAGDLTPQGHVLTQRVYYEDTDFSGVVYHARYLHFMERGRTDFLRLLGVEQAKLHASEGEGMAFVVLRREIDFKSSARMDDVLTILTRSEKAAGAKLILAQEVRLGERVLIAARVTVAVVNRAGRPRRLPADLAEKFS
jgi:acyl-CoA thioester hydrolase